METVKTGASVLLFASVFSAFGAVEVSTTSALLKAIEDAPSDAVTEIRLAAGDYGVDHELVIEKPVHIVGPGWRTTSIFRDYKESFRVMTLNNRDALVKGVAITNGLAPTTGAKGVQIEANGGALEDCRIADNKNANLHDNWGGGVCMNSADARVTRCVIENNVNEGNGGGHGAGVYVNKGLVEDSLIRNNTIVKGSGYGGGVFANGECLVRNCTIIGNKASSKGGGIYINSNKAKIVNCVIDGNICAADTSVGAPDWYGTASCYVNCFAPVAANDTCVTGDPQYLDAANGDYRFFLGSVLRDAGTDAQGLGETDLDGNVRTSGAAVDIGCFEYDSTQSAIGLTIAPRKMFVGGSVTLNPVLLNVPVEAARTWTLTDMTGATLTFGRADEASAKVDVAGLYDVTLTVGEGADAKTFTQPDYLYVAPLTNYVDCASTDPVPPYATPETAAQHPLDALEYANRIDGSVVLVKDGDYQLVTAGIKITAGVTFVSEHGAEKTSLWRTPGSSGEKFQIVDINNMNATVRGFTIRGGYWSSGTQGNGGAGVHIDVYGGRLEDCVVSNNTCAIYDAGGGGVGVRSSDGHVSRCIICNNSNSGGTYSYGGGANLNSGTIDNCLIVNNTSAKCGGGLFLSGSAKAYNCTVYGNKASGQINNYAGGGIRLVGASARAYNCAVFGNTANNEGISGNPDWSASASEKECFVNCAFKMSANDTTLVAETPSFVDLANGNYRLDSGSTLRDAGADVEGIGETDLDGNPRKSLGSAPDIGCYEYDKSQVSIGLTVTPTKGFAGASYTFVPTLDGLDPSVARVWKLTDERGRELTFGTEAESGVEIGSGNYSVTLTVNPGAEGELSKTLPNALFVVPPTNYVNCAVSESVPPYDNPAQAAKTIQEALAYAIDESVVVVAPGDYVLTGPIELYDAVRLVAAEGADKTRLIRTGKDAAPLFAPVYINNKDARVKGFAITGGYTTSKNGGGVLIAAGGGWLEDCIVTNNVCKNYDSQGGGVCCDSADGHISRCRILHNQAGPNGSYEFGGGVSISAGTIDNCLIAWNVAAKRGGGLYLSGGAKAYNCTIYGNTATKYTGGGVCTQGVGSDGGLWNCASFGNTADNEDASGTPEWSWRDTPADTNKIYNCALPKKLSPTTVVTDDPGFASLSVGAEDFSLASGSPLIDAGADVAGVGETDLAGNPRKSFDPRQDRESPVDIGCYEYDKTQIAIGLQVTPVKGFEGGQFSFVPTLDGLEEDTPRVWTLTAADGSSVDYGTEIEAIGGFALEESGVYTVTLTATPADHAPYVATREAYLTVYPRTNYVNVASTNPVAPYGTPETAATNVLDVIDYTMEGSVVLVADGVYDLWKQIEIQNGVTVVSEHGAERTTLQRPRYAKQDDHRYRPLYLNHENAVIRGFTITGGYAGDGGGGGILIGQAGGTVEDCVVISNKTTSGDMRNGGGINMSSAKGLVRRCVVALNTISNNNGIHHYGSGICVTAGRVESCLVVSNSVSGGLSAGSAALYLGDGQKAFNCTIVGNAAPIHTGGLYQSGGSKAYNCVMFGNNCEALGKDETADVFCDHRDNLVNCAAPAEYNATCVVLTGDPGFRNAAAGDFTLTALSPLVNKGANGDYTADSRDLFGNARVFNFGKKSGIVDIGCCESSWGTPGLMLYVK